MRPIRLFCADLAVGRLDIDPTQARHALRTLRLRPGDAVTLFDGRGASALATLTAGPARALRVTVDRVDHAPPPVARLTLIIAAPKGPRLDWMVEKCTELGVSRIALADFERSVVHPAPTHL